MNTKYITSGLLAAMIVSSTAFLTSCANDLEVGKNIDESTYSSIYEDNAYLRDGKSNLVSKVVELHGKTYVTTVKMGLSKAPDAATPARVKINAACSETYNKAHSTDFALYPQDLITFANEGIFTVNANVKSAEVKMTIRTEEGLQGDRAYVTPVAISDQSSDITIKDEGARHCIYLMKDIRNAGDVYKRGGVMQDCLSFEVNDVNPLNTLSFQLESGRFLWDIVVLFATNINYDAEAGRPRVQCNPNVQYLLDNSGTLPQPLRRRGVKVLLGLLGNHDITGLAQLSEQGARDFAREVAQHCKAYSLDGVSYDDEYSNSPDLSNPSLINPNTIAAARLCYKTKQVVPDKLVTMFDWGQIYGVATVDGVDAKEWIDIVVANYGSAVYPIGQMIKKQCSGISMGFSLGGGGSLSASRTQGMVDGGYGWLIGFTPSPAKYSSVFSRPQGGGKVLYGSNAAAPTIFYRKNDPTPYRYPDDL